MLTSAGITHVAHGVGDPVAAGVAAAEDPSAVVLLGPFRSADVSETIEATAPAGLPLISPMATWAGVTRDDEPGCDDPAEHRGTVFRLLARDTVVAARIAADARRNGLRAFVVAGDHDYGRQLDGQLHLVDLPRIEDPHDAQLLVLCGLAGEPEIERARSLAQLPLIAFGCRAPTLVAIAMSSWHYRLRRLRATLPPSSSPGSRRRDALRSSSSKPATPGLAIVRPFSPGFARLDGSMSTAIRSSPTCGCGELATDGGSRQIGR